MGKGPYFCHACEVRKGGILGDLTVPEKIQGLQQKLYDKAKREPNFRFYALSDKLCREDILAFSYRLAKSNGGAGGVDGETFSSIESKGVEAWLEGLQSDLKEGRYHPSPVRRVEIPKATGGFRPLGIPTIRDRVVQTAMKLLLEPIFEADLSDSSYGYRPGRSALGAVKEVHRHLCDGYTEVVDADLSKYFDTIPHDDLMKSVERRVSDGRILALLRAWLKVPVEERDERGNRRMSGGKKRKEGTPQGGVISPLLANIYMNRLLKAFAVRASQLDAKIVAYADDLVILSRTQGAVCYRWLATTLNKIGLTLNEDKTSIKEATKETFDFLGYRFGLEHYRKDGHTYLAAQPSRHSVSRLKDKLRDILAPGNKAPIEEVVKVTNRVLDGWSRYFSYGTRTMAYRAVDNFVQRRVLKFLRQRHKRRDGASTCFRAEVIYDRIGFRRLRTVQLGSRVGFA